MQNDVDSQRRRALTCLLAGVGSIALPARLSLAAIDSNPESPRLVVVMLRGALDGLAAVAPVGDPDHAALRGHHDALQGGAHPLSLDSFYALHPALQTLHRWWAERQLIVLHAVASPYRERSHFDAQQMIESGGDRPFALQTGWLGRALQAAGKPAVALSPAMPLALRGAAQASTWTPDRRDGGDEDLWARIARLYGQDPALGGAWTKALAQQGMAREAGSASVGKPGNDKAAGDDSFASMARQAGAFLTAERGARVAWLEMGGWDTHFQQAARLQRQLGSLDRGLAALRDALGVHWARTAVLVMTEFGRTVAINGTGGTDHGTGAVAFLAGGAVAGGRVLADWPGLSARQLWEGRDLRPTQDIRPVMGALLQRQLGMSLAQIQSGVLPGVVSADRLALWRSA